MSYSTGDQSFRIHQGNPPRLANIYDGLPLTGARSTTGVGTRHCERFLAHLLRSNSSKHFRPRHRTRHTTRRPARHSPRPRAAGVAGWACPRAR
jgi:hypothetical protein